MTRTPYTDSIAKALNTDVDALLALAAPGADSPIATCAMAIATTLWEMQSAERTANEHVNALQANVAQQAANLAGEGKGRFDASWLTHHATKAAEASANLTAGGEKIRAFKNLLDKLVNAA